MSDDTKQETSYVLPTPDLPKLEMPEAPEVGRTPDDEIVSCDGEATNLKMYDMPSPVPPPEEGKLRILIGVPILTYSHEFVQGFLRFWTQLCNMRSPDGKSPFQVGYHFLHRKPVHLAETELVKLALWNKCTHILFMDDDIYDVTLADLQKLIDAKKEVISGVMYASGFPYAMCVFRRYDTQKKVIDMPSDNTLTRLYEVPCQCPKCGFGMSHWDAKFCPVSGATCDNLLQKADLIPFPFTLIDLKIFEKLKKPWFHCSDAYPSDSWFCDRCHEAGIPLYGHMAVRLNHRGVTDLTRHFLQERDLALKRATNDGGLVNVTEDEMAKHQFILNKKMKEAEDRCKPQVDFLNENKEVPNDSTKTVVPDGVPEKASAEVPG